LLDTLAKILEYDSIQAAPLQPVSLRQSATEFNLLLKALERRINPEQIQGFKRLKWPFSKTENERMIQRIERYKAAFNLALNIEQT
jgi:hypothetical protein